MRKISVIAALMPWLLFAGAIAAQKAGITGQESMVNAGMLWLFMSPLWFAAGCLVSYREGQWSIK